MLLAESHVSNHGEMLVKLSTLFALEYAVSAITVLTHLQRNVPDLLIINAVIPNEHAFPEGETDNGSRTVILLLGEIRDRYPDLPVLVYNADGGRPRGLQKNGKTVFMPLFPTTLERFYERAVMLARNGR